MTKFDIEVVSDTVCPWCYVGKQKLDKAIKVFKERNPDANDEFNITWKPFYLNPDSPMQGTDKQAMYESKFGVERTRMMQTRLFQIGLENGIKFSYGGKTGNTRNSHRLIALAKSKSPFMQTRTVEELFKLYFEQEGDITSIARLQEAGVKAGLDESEVKSWLASDDGGEEVDKEVREAQIRGISGVPNFTIDGKYEVGGAQDESVFLELFDRIKKGERSNVAVDNGSRC